MAARDDLLKESEKKSSTIELMQKELDLVKQELASNEAKTAKLSAENKQLVDRLLEQKQKEVEAMNQVNELYTLLLKARNDIEILKKNSQSAANSMPTNKYSGKNESPAGELSPSLPSPPPPPLPDQIQEGLALGENEQIIDNESLPPKEAFKKIVSLKKNKIKHSDRSF